MSFFTWKSNNYQKNSYVSLLILVWHKSSHLLKKSQLTSHLPIEQRNHLPPILKTRSVVGTRNNFQKKNGWRNFYNQVITYVFVCNNYAVSNSCVFVNYTIPAYNSYISTGVIKNRLACSNHKKKPNRRDGNSCKTPHRYMVWISFLLYFYFRRIIVCCFQLFIILCPYV